MIQNVTKTWLFNIFLIMAVSQVMIQTGCTIRLISSYDEKTDEAITDMQKKFETFFLTLESQEGLPECEYENHTEFYKDAKVSISAIEVRARAIPDNEITIKQVVLLKENISLLEQLHIYSCLSKEEIEPLRISFNSGFTAILKLELAKMRGD